MNAPQHKNLEQGRWFGMTLPEQLGNVGSEYSRAWRWKGANRPDYADKAIDRMLELLDLTLADSRWRNHRLKELSRLREQVCGEFFLPDQQPALQKYFDQFAQAARMGR